MASGGWYDGGLFLGVDGIQEREPCPETTGSANVVKEYAAPVGTGGSASVFGLEEKTAVVTMKLRASADILGAVIINKVEGFRYLVHGHLKV